MTNAFRHLHPDDAEYSWVGRIGDAEGDQLLIEVGRARLAERERDVAARKAIVEERARIARAVHDAVTHSVSMMTAPPARYCGPSSRSGAAC